MDAAGVAEDLHLSQAGDYTVKRLYLMWTDSAKIEILRQHDWNQQILGIHAALKLENSRLNVVWSVGGRPDVLKHLVGGLQRASSVNVCIINHLTWCFRSY